MDSKEQFNYERDECRMMNEQVVELLTKQFYLSMREDDELKDLKLSISTEQQFAKIQDKTKNTIYIVIKFLEGTLNYQEKLLPFTLTAISERNKYELCLKLFTLFADKYNLTTNNEGTMTQSYASPVVVSNFVEIYEGWHNVIQMSGMMLVTKNANSFQLSFMKENGEYEEVDTITSTFSFDNTLDTQPFFNSNNITQSKARYGTITINIALYLTDIELINKVLKIAFKQLSNDTTFDFKLKHKNGLELVDSFKLVNYTTEKAIGQLQVCSMTFTK